MHLADDWEWLTEQLYHRVYHCWGCLLFPMSGLIFHYCQLKQCLHSHCSEAVWRRFWSWLQVVIIFHRVRLSSAHANCSANCVSCGLQAFKCLSCSAYCGRLSAPNWRVWEVSCYCSGHEKIRLMSNWVGVKQISAFLLLSLSLAIITDTIFYLTE